MKRFASCLLVLLALMLAAPSRSQEGARTGSYSSRALGVRLSAPADVFPQPIAFESEAEGFGGRTTDGAATWTVLAERSAGRLSLAEAYSKAQRNYRGERLRVTYKVLRKNWFVVSGYEGDRIFYKKTLWRGGSPRTLQIWFPAKEKPRYYRVVEAMSHSFQPL